MRGQSNTYIAELSQQCPGAEPDTVCIWTHLSYAPENGEGYRAIQWGWAVAPSFQQLTQVRIEQNVVTETAVSAHDVSAERIISKSGTSHRAIILQPLARAKRS